MIQQGGNWYWTTAYLDAWDSANPASSMRLSSNGNDWHPDWQTTDVQAPTSSMQPLPVQSPATFTVSWSGTDAGPAGIAGFSVQVKDGPGGAWTNWVAGGPANTSAPYTGIGGRTYYFRSQARDAAGNLEPWPADYDAFTTVEALPPQTSMVALALYSHNGVPVQWSGSDPGSSGVASYDVQVRRDTGGWTDWLMGTTETAALFDGTPGSAYGFRVRAKDKAQNVAAWPAAADATTTLYTWAIKGHVTDNRGAPVVDMATTTMPAAFLAPPSDVEGAFAAYVADEAGSYTVNWDKAAYSALPGTVFPAPQDAAADVVLPPADNAVQNWGFEGGTDSWQFGGNLAGTITGTDKHSGAAAALLGSGVTPLQTVTTLAGPGLQGESLFMDSAIDATDVIHVVWIGQDNRVMYRSRPSRGVWNLPDPLPGPVALHMARPKIVVDSAGTIHVVWSGDYTTYYSWKQAGEEWWNSESIPGSPRTWEKPGLVLGLDGTVKVVWATEGYGDLYYRQRRPNGVWSTAAHYLRHLWPRWRNQDDDRFLRICPRGMEWFRYFRLCGCSLHCRDRRWIMAAGCQRVTIRVPPQRLGYGH